MTSRRHGINSLVWLAIFLLLAARIHLLLVRVYDPDELEHIHAGYCVAHGQTPYRDFFEHHGPLTYWLGSVLVRINDAARTAIPLHRLASFGLTLACIWGTFSLGNSLYGRRSAALALLVLLSLPIFVEKQVEWRPDAIAVALIPWAAWLLVRRDSSAWIHALGAGLLLGMATLATVKAAPLAIGMAIGSSLCLRPRVRPSVIPAPAGIQPSVWLLGHCLAILLGMTMPWVLATAVFAWQGALGEAWQCVVVAPLAWPVQTQGPDPVWGMTAWAPGHQVLGIVGIALCALGWRRSLRRHDIVLFMGILFHAIALIFARAVYLQFYMLAMPLLAVLATGVTRQTLRLWRRKGRPLFAYVLGVLALTWFCIGAWKRGVWFWPGDPLPSNPYSLLDVGGYWLAIALFACAILLRSWRACAIALGVLLFLPALARVAIPHLYWPNTDQIAVMQFVEKVVPADQSVLDGFTGYGALRPHAWYWYWVNEHTLAMIQAARQTSVPTQLVREGIPALVIVDASLATLLTPDDLAGRYVRIASPEGRPFAFYLRRDLVENYD